MKHEIAIAVLIFEICCISSIFPVTSATCGELEHKIKAYKNEISSLKISLEEYELAVGKTEDNSDECNESPTCSLCFREKRNFQCGWCTLRNRCSLRENCPGNVSASDFWISGNDKCPKIRGVIPHNIPASKSKVLQIVIPHLPDYDGIFVCSFEVLGKTLVTKGQQYERGITCESPASDSVPKIPVEDDHMNVELSVRIPNGPNFASTSNFTLYDCRRYQSCSECSSSIFPCVWCMAGMKCTDSEYDCRNDIIVFSKSITRPTLRQGSGYCPRASSYIESENELLVPSGSKKRIAAKVENLMGMHLQTKFTCKVRGFPSVNGQILGDTVYCSEMNLRVLGREPVYNLSFSIYWDEHRKLDGDLHVVVYHCERMAGSCGECIDLPVRYKCGWCVESDSCTLEHSCADSVWMDDKHTCKNPEITSIYPTSGVMSGKTDLTIEGVNLAKEFKDIESVAAVNEEDGVIIDCIPSKHLHVRHSRIVCLLDTSEILLENNRTLMGYIQVKLSNGLAAISEEQFSFVDPVITGFQPTKGMASGGTILKITGDHLDVGNEVEVYIGDLPCRVISRGRSNVRCISSPISTTQTVPNSSIVRILFDGEERTSSTYFFYVADPSVHSVKGEYGSASPAGTPSGGNLIIVEGSNFDYVPSPYIYVVADGVEYPGICNVISETHMECHSPRIPAGILNLCNEEGSLLLHYGFRMGDVQSVQNISRLPDFGMYRVFPDPYLLPFNEEGKIKIFKHDYLTIQGKYLDNVFDGSDFNVTVGDRQCRMTSLSHTQLTCKPPDLQPDVYGEDRLFQVQVRLRPSLEYFIGFLRYENN